MTVATGADEVLLSLKEGLADLYGERLWGVILYGSYASEASDGDVLVSASRPKKRRAKALARNCPLRRSGGCPDLLGVLVEEADTRQDEPDHQVQNVGRRVSVQ
jgi:hypothetical protein